MRTIQAAIGATILLIAIIGCAVPIDFGDPFPKERPAEADLPGVYLPTDYTLDKIARGGYAPRKTSIELRADETFQIQNMPDWWRNAFGKSTGGFDSGSGKWRIVQQSSWWRLELDIPSMKDFARPDERGWTKEVYLLGQTPPYGISITVGDPDSGGMHFRKIPARTAPAP